MSRSGDAGSASWTGGVAPPKLPVGGIKDAISHGIEEGMAALGISFRGGLTMGRELAEVLMDLAPHLLHGKGSPRLETSYGSRRKHMRGSKLSLKVRLSRAKVADVGTSLASGGEVGREPGGPPPAAQSGWDYSRVCHVAKTEDLKGGLDAPAGAEPVLVEVNSGGAVFFLFLDGDPAAAAPPRGGEHVAVIKFCASRLDAQAELFGAEVAAQLDVRAPMTRIIYSNSAEYGALRAGVKAAEAGRDAGCAAELVDWLEDAQCVLLMTYVRGSRLKAPALQGGFLKATAEQLGRVMALDMVLANADRLPCELLGWRGNAGNLLHTRESAGGPGGGIAGGDLVAIDSGIPRRLPGPRSKSDAQRLPQAAELLCTDPAGVAAGLVEAVAAAALPMAAGGGAGGGGLNWSEDRRLEIGEEVAKGFRHSAALADRLKGLLEMVLEKVNDNLDEFLSDLNGTDPSARPPDASKSAGPGGAGSGGSTPAAPPRAAGGAALSWSPGVGGGESPGAGGEGEIVGSPPGRPPARLLSRKLEGMQAAGKAVDLNKPLPRGTKIGGRAAGGGGGKGARLGGRVQQLSTTAKLRKIRKISKADEETAWHLEAWGEVLRDEAINIRGAIDEWRESRGITFPLTTGFLNPESHIGTNVDELEEGAQLPDGGFRSIVDSYELMVRLQQMLDRIRVVTHAATGTRRPTAILPDLFVGDILCAQSTHTLRHLGITHILNLAKELEHLEAGGMERLHLGLMDTVDEDIGSYFEKALSWVDAAHAKGGRVLVHCFEGKSRSVTVCLAFLMTRKKWNLAKALGHVQGIHPAAKPNPTFMAKLSALDVEMWGVDSLPKDEQSKMQRMEERRKYLEQRLQKRGTGK